MNILQFADKMDLNIDIKYHNKKSMLNNDGRFTAMISGMDISISDGDYLVSCCGSGKTMKEALNDLAKEISNQLVSILDFETETRTHIWVSKLSKIR